MGHKEKLRCHKLFLKIYDETNHNAESGKFENLRTNITNKNIDIFRISTTFEILFKACKYY